MILNEIANTVSLLCKPLINISYFGTNALGRQGLAKHLKLAPSPSDVASVLSITDEELSEEAGTQGLERTVSFYTLCYLGYLSTAAEKLLNRIQGDNIRVEREFWARVRSLVRSHIAAL